MKKIFYLFFCLLFIDIQAQNSDYVALYDLKFVRNNSTSDKEQFILLINSKKKESVFLSSTEYSEIVTPSSAMSLISSEFKEIVYFDTKKFNIYEDVINGYLSYIDTDVLKWELMNKNKRIGNYNCKLASVNAYGRIWYAWYSIDIPLNYGPYKFNGLPGLIVELYDSENKAYFSLVQFKKKSMDMNFFSVKKYKLVAREKYYKARFKILTSDSGAVVFKSAQERKEWLDGLLRLYRSQLIFDIKYPQE